MTKVLLIVGSLTYGGAERQVVELANGLNKKKFKVYVCSLSESNPLRDELESSEVDFRIIKKRSHYDPFVVFRIANLVRKEKIELVQTFTFTANSFGRLGAHLGGAKIIIGTHRKLDANLRFREVVTDRLVNRYSTVIAVNTPAIREFLLQRKLVKPEKVVVINNGVDLRRFKEDTAIEGRNGRCNSGVSQPVAAIVGRLSTEKRHEVFLRVARLVINELPNAKFWIVGDGDMQLREKLTLLTQSLNISETVSFLGNRNDIPELLQEIDCLVLCSKYEGFPNVVIEAMAAGKPVVVTDVSDLRQIVEHGEMGYVAPVDDDRAIASYVTALLKDSRLKQKFGANARRRAQDFSVEKMVAQHEALYEDLLSSNHRN